MFLDKKMDSFSWMPLSIEYQTKLDLPLIIIPFQGLQSHPYGPIILKELLETWEIPNQSGEIMDQQKVTFIFINCCSFFK